MLTNTLRVLIYKLFLEIFYGKIINQLILLTTFYISYKSYVKPLLIWFISNCLEGIR